MQNRIQIEVERINVVKAKLQNNMKPTDKLAEMLVAFEAYKKGKARYNMNTASLENNLFTPTQKRITKWHNRNRDHSGNTPPNFWVGCLPIFWCSLLFTCSIQCAFWTSTRTTSTRFCAHYQRFFIVCFSCFQRGNFIMTTLDQRMFDWHIVCRK